MMRWQTDHLRGTLIMSNTWDLSWTVIHYMINCHFQNHAELSERIPQSAWYPASWSCCLWLLQSVPPKMDTNYYVTTWWYPLKKNDLHLHSTLYMWLTTLTQNTKGWFCKIKPKHPRLPSSSQSPSVPHAQPLHVPSWSHKGADTYAEVCNLGVVLRFWVIGATAFSNELQTKFGTWRKDILKYGGPLSGLQWWHLVKPSWWYHFKVGPYRFCSNGNPTTLTGKKVAWASESTYFCCLETGFDQLPLGILQWGCINALIGMSRQSLSVKGGSGKTKPM